MSTALVSLAFCLFVSVISLCTYIVYSTGMKLEMHVWNSDREVKCHVFYL